MYLTKILLLKCDLRKWRFSKQINIHEENFESCHLRRWTFTSSTHTVNIHICNCKYIICPTITKKFKKKAKKK